MNLPDIGAMRAQADGIRSAIEANTAQMEKLLAQLAIDRQIPDLNQADFATTTLGWRMLIPPQNASIFVTGVWFTSRGSDLAVGFGQGSSTSNAVRFQSFLEENGATAGLFPLATDGGFSMSKAPWIYRTDTGSGFMLYNGGDGKLVAGHLTYYIGDVNSERAGDQT